MHSIPTLRLNLLRVFSVGLCMVAAVASAGADGLSVTMSDALGTDVNGDGVLNPGDSIVYTAKVTNSGNQSVSGLVFTPAIDPSTPLVAGSVRVSPGTVTKGNAANDSMVAVALDPLAAAAMVTITFEVSLPATALRPASGVVSTSAVLSDGENMIASDDPDTAAVQDPTVTPVVVPTPVVPGSGINLQLSGGGFAGGCSVGRGSPTPGPLLFILVAALGLALRRRRAQPVPGTGRPVSDFR